MLKRLCVFCGSSSGKRPEYIRAARDFGTLLAHKKIGLVYGGGRTGLMGAVADAALLAGGEVIGVIPESLATKELKHDGVTQLHVVNSMHERKAMMAELSDAFAALPGGMGTFEELCEMLTWAQLGIHDKPCGILNVENFFDPLLKLFDHAVKEKFVRPDDRALLFSSENHADLLEQLRTYRPPARKRWVGPVES